MTFDEHLATLPAERRGEVERVWRAVRASVPAGYAEQINNRFLTFAADGEALVMLGNQKNYISLYLMPLYAFPELKTRLDASGKRIKCGKSCINFSRADDLPLDAVAGILAEFPDPHGYKEQMRRLRDGCDPRTNAAD